MKPFISGENDLENRIRDCLRRHSVTEAQLLVERLPDGVARTFLEGWIAFLKGDIGRAAAQLVTLTPVSPTHPFALLQAELHDECDERRFLALIEAGEAYEPSSTYLTELKAFSLLQLGRVSEAERALRRALQQHHGHRNLQNALATVLAEQGAFGECLTILRKLRDTYPNHWEPLSNLACVLNNIGKMDEAIDLYRRAIVIAPSVAVLRLNHSIALLKAGRFAQGWNEHEWRLKLPGHTSLPYERILPSLTPQNNLEGKLVLVTQEEGLGDSLMYLRYLPLLSQYGARVHVWGSHSLANLVQNTEGVDVVQVGGKRPDYDYHCPFISLPRVFNGIPDAHLGTKVPYMRVSPDKTTHWAERVAHIGNEGHLRVGLAWAGGRHRNDRAARLLDHHRSMALSELAPLKNLTQVEFYSLQKGPAEDQINDSPLPIINLMPDCHDMEDTAALIQALDLVVTVDTSIVHLAGGLGKDTILMDRFCNCWRWGYKTTSSQWYPSLRIFRQTIFDDWEIVVQQVYSAIQERLSHRTP